MESEVELVELAHHAPPPPPPPEFTDEELVELAHHAPPPPETVDPAPASQWPQLDVLIGPSGTVRYAPVPGWRPTARTEIEELEPALGSRWQPPVTPEEERVPVVQEEEERVPMVQEEEEERAPVVQEEEEWAPVVQEEASSSSGAGGGAGSAPSSSSAAGERTRSSGGAGASAQPFDSERLPPTLVQEIQPPLRLANLLDGEAPRVAYLCRLHAFEKANLMDPKSEERGVMQFKTALIQTLHQDDKITSLQRTESNDAREIDSFYEKKKKANAHDLMPVLAEVLRAVLIRSGLESLVVSCGELPTSDLGAQGLPRHYNILPLAPSSRQEPIMLLIEIKFAVAAIFNVQSLPLGSIKDETSCTDIFQWLQSWFGFQSGNVANQREHAILLLANMHARLNPDSSSTTLLDDRAVDRLLDKTFKNYLTWCKYLGRESNIRFPEEQEVQQYKLLYVALYLLIWGEAANLRHMPECLCYIFHYMSYELYGIISGAERILTGEKIIPAYGGEEESFLKNVVTPIYKEMIAEAVKSENGPSDHSTWRNYDDLNEFFWSADCFKLGWPMRLDHDFFFLSRKIDSAESKQTEERRWLGKTNFVEVRSLWHLFRSFDRMWTLLVLGLQILIIMAWHGLESPLQLLRPTIFEDIMSIFITNAVLRVIQVIIDIAFSWSTKAMMTSSQKLKFSMKIFFAVTWSIILPTFYSTSARCANTFLRILCLSKYMVAVLLYLTSNVIGIVLFFIPSLRNYIETSTWRICRILSWWCQIKPLVEGTKAIMKVNVNRYEWHELFPQVKSNAGGILAMWAPIMIVYFIDTQIWYSVFCAIFGGMSGIARHMDSSKSEGDDPTKFAMVWNEIISSFRSEDLINNRELDLMTMPMSLEYSSTCWPLFLLAEKLSRAVDMAAKFTGSSAELFSKIKKDNNMFCALTDFYDLTKRIFSFLVIGAVEKRVVDSIFAEIEKSVHNTSLLVDFKLADLATLVDKVHCLSEILYKNKEEREYDVTILLQDIIDILIQDMLVDAQSILDQINSYDTMISINDGALSFYKPELFASISSISKICFPFPDSGPLKEQVKRLYLLLNTKEKAVDIPSNLEARRRISFFATSLLMNMPAAPQVRSMLSFSIITPYFMEEVKYSEEELHSNQDEGSILSYMQKIYPDEWRFFLERLGSKVTNEEIRYWASFRGQTLSRTVRGMMYYRKALRLQAYLDRKNDQELCEGPVGTEGGEIKNIIDQSLTSELDTLAEMKFSYVIACPKYGEYKSDNDPRAQDIIDLMSRYPALRVAYIEEKEIIIGNRPRTVYSSVLIKAENNFDQEIYRIKLPGAPIIGEGRPENQNLAIIFTRGEALQTIDSNQDNYLEEAYKMRNVLQEFVRHPRDQSPTIVGLREHIFTGRVSPLAGIMSSQEMGFVTIGQRFLADPLRVRFHYGHSDIFDRMFHLTRGGISKASKATNLSDGVFGGFNSILRRGHVTYNEYIQVGKGHDVGFNEISKFEAKVANGNGEQTISREIYRLGQRLDFFRMLSFYYTTVGFDFNSVVSLFGVYIFMYGQLYFVLSGLHKAVLNKAENLNLKSLETALSSQSIFQLGLLTGLPMVMELGLEQGFRAALSDFIVMQLQAAPVFFTFSLGTKAHYYVRTILHGGAKYRATERKFVSVHASFKKNYQLYSRSHFVKGFELMCMLTIYHAFIGSHVYNMTYVMPTYSTWFMAVTWLFAPFIFNPAGFAWHRIVGEWADWNKWMSDQGGIGVQPEKSWYSWWNAENSHLRYSSLSSRIFEVLLSLRFFLYQYELVYYISVIDENKAFLVYLLSWIIVIAIVGFVKFVNWASCRLSSDHQLIFRLIKLLIFLLVLTVWILLSRFCKLSFMDLIISCLAFIPTGWGLLLIVQVLRPKVEDYMIWEPVQIIACTYDYIMGTLLFVALSVLAWIPTIPATQTRVLFQKALSRKPEILPFIRALDKAKRR